MGEVKVMLELSKLGLPIFREISNTSKTDIITIVNNKCLKIQCKCINYEKNNSILVPLVSSTSNELYTKFDFDILAVYIPFLEKVIYVNWDEIGEKESISFRYKEGTGKQKNNKNIKYVDSYLEFKRFFDNGVVA